MMASRVRGTAVLAMLLGLTAGASILHYVDNVLRFGSYSEPAWLGAWVVDAFWFVMTPTGVGGYMLWRRGARKIGSFGLAAYSVMNLLTLGHYRYAAPRDMSFRINTFIWLEVLSAALLLGAVVWYTTTSWPYGRRRL